MQLYVYVHVSSNFTSADFIWCTYLSMYEEGTKSSWTGAIKLILCKIELSNFAHFLYTQ